MSQESAPADAEPSPTAAERPAPRQYVWILVVAALLGIPVALAAAAFMSLSHALTTLVWTTIPGQAAWSDGPPWWYVVLMPVVAGLVVALALRLPGHAG